MLRLTPFTLLLVLAATHSAFAHTGCGGVPIGRRNTGGEVIQFRKRQVMDEPSAASSVDTTYECTPYTYAPVSSIESSYPAIWETANILPGDTTAQAIFATINASVSAQFPNDLPKGTANGIITGINYTNADPDCWWTWKGCTTPAPSTGLQADISTVPEPMTWGLTYDDGPNCSHNALYDFLNENNQKATLFYIGSNVMDWPLQALRGMDDGHHLCVHTWSHQYMTSFTNEIAFAELYYTRKIIKDIIGVTPLCWRPPYGDVDNRIRSIAAGLNLTTILWSDDTEDWKVGANDGVTPADVDMNYQAVINKTMNGTYTSYGPVVLTHELTNYTMSESLSFYPKIKAAFNHIVPIAAAYNMTHPYVEQNITYPDFQAYVAGTTNQTVGATTSSSSSSAASSAASSGASSGASSTTAASTANAAVSSSSNSGSASVSKAASSSKGAAGRAREVGMGMGAGIGGVVVVLGMLTGAFLI